MTSIFKLNRKKIKEGKYKEKTKDTSPSIQDKNFENNSSVITDTEYEVTAETKKETNK